MKRQPNPWFKFIVVLIVLTSTGAGCANIPATANEPASSEPTQAPILVATPSPSPESPVTSEPQATLSASNVLFHDDFTNPATGWPEDKFDNYFVGYHEPEYYHVEVTSPNYKTIVFEPGRQSLTDFTTREFRASNAYRYYVVWLLFVVYVFNFVDRQILSIDIEPIKQEFGLHDWQLALLSGLAFSAFYSTLGIPIARVADRRNRVNIIGIAIVVWSAFTAVSGLARSFWHLLIARIGVGIGEAGCSPPAYSIISDYFEPHRRATALSIYSMGVYGGAALGFLIGGLVANVHGWRVAFFVVGLPGLLVALLLKLTLREPQSAA